MAPSVENDEERDLPKGVNRVGHDHENGQGPMSIAAFRLKLHAEIV